MSEKKHGPVFTHEEYTVIMLAAAEGTNGGVEDIQAIMTWAEGVALAHDTLQLVLAGHLAVGLKDGVVTFRVKRRKK